MIKMGDEEELIDDDMRMPTNERLRQSKKKRIQQLKKYAQHEKQVEKENSKKSKKLEKAAEQKKDKKVQFPGSITLLEAAARNDKDEVRRLLRIGVSPDVCNDDGLTALHQCCIDDESEMLNVLLEFGAKVNATDCELWTPLHAAATCGRIHLCRRLIEHGADLLAVNGDGNMPYDICDHEATLDYIECEMAKQGITQELIDETRLIREKVMLNDLKELHTQNGDLEFRGGNGETPLHVAAANGYLDVAEFLLSHRVLVDPVDNELWQPIHCAACWGQLAVLELLLEHGASLEGKTKTGSTPLDMCEDTEMKQKILEIKEDIENSRIAKSREISRRHSSTVRRNRISRGNSVMFSSSVSLEKSHLSASVRRTSMREKNEISWKEAKEEARRMMENADTLQDMDDDDDLEKENGIPLSYKLNKRNPNSIHLAPLVSVEEILDVRLETLNAGADTNGGPEISDTPSPRSPEPLLGRGINFGVNLVPLVCNTASNRVDELELKTVDSLPAVPRVGILSGTLPELKKQRSNNRLSEMQVYDVDLEFGSAEQTQVVTASTKSDTNGNMEQPDPAACYPTDSSKSCLTSSSKPSTQTGSFARKCCVII